MIAVYPFLLVVAVLVAAGRREEGGRGWRWFGVWCVAGALFTFSLLTGFSIGLFLLPLVAGSLFYAALAAPHLEEGAGFVAGAGAVAVSVAVLSWGEGHTDTTAWFAAGAAAIAIAVAAFGSSRTRAR